MPPSPLDAADGPLSIEIRADGQPLPATAQLIAATIRLGCDAIPSATLEFSDGDRFAGDWPLADSPALVPGTRIEIVAGYGPGSVPGAVEPAARLYAGIVVRMGVRLDAAGGGRVTVECQDRAARLDVVPRSAHHRDCTDAEVLEALVASHGLQADIPATDIRHPALLQHRCTDWQFLRARARALGRLVIVDDGRVRVIEPAVNGTAALTVTWGSDLLGFEAELDARMQFESVRSRAWDARTQSMVVSTAADPVQLQPQGNLSGAALADTLALGPVDLPALGPADNATLAAQARAQQVRSALSRLRGCMRFLGSARAVPGALIEVAGMGQRFNGSALVTRVTHHLADGSWTTEVGFGLPVDGPASAATAGDIEAGGSPAVHDAAKTARGPGDYSGDHPGNHPGAPAPPVLHIGVVTQLGDDPAGDCRVQVRLPAAGLEGLWARLLQARASQAFGAFVLPEIGDEVLVGFRDDDPATPVVLGSLYSRAHPPAEALSDENPVTAFRTRSGMRLGFDDRDGSVHVTTADGRELRLDDRQGVIALRDRHGNEVRLDAAGLSLSSPKDLRIEALGAVTIAAGTGLHLGAGTDLTLKGLNITGDAQLALTARGGASAELSAAGSTTVRGAMVMIN